MSKTKIENVEKGIVYFKNYGIIEMLEVPEFGSVTLKSQNGEIVSYSKTITGQFKKKY